MIKTCRECGKEFDARGRWCPACALLINKAKEEKEAPARHMAEELGLIPTGFGYYEFPPDMGPEGFENYFGVIGFRAINPEPNTKWPGFYYSVLTWDCPEGLSGEYPLTGIKPWEMITLSR